MQTSVFDVTDAISYKRFSSGRQARGNSVARQTDMAEEYAARHGLRIMDTYLDAGVSAYDGTNGDTGALRHMLDAAKAGKFRQGTPLLIESLDRLSRRAAWRAQRLLTELVEAKLVVVTLVDELVYSEQSLDEDPMRFMMSIAIMIRSNDESKNKSKRSLDNRAREREQVRTSKTLIGRRKAWVDKGKDGKGIPNDHAPTVLRIYQDAASGYGAMKIAARLNDSRVATFGGGERWYPGSVLCVLNDDAVMGIYQPHHYEKLPGDRRKRVPLGDPVEGYYPVVVPLALVDRAREGLINRLNARGRSGPTWANLVKGLCRCAVCKGRVHHFERVRGYPYLRCYAATGVRGCSNHTGFPYKKFEEHLYTLHELHVGIADMIPRKPDESANDLARLKIEMARTQQWADSLIDDLETRSPGPAKEAVQRRLDQRNEELESLRRCADDARRKMRNSERLAARDIDARFAAAKAKVQSDDANERREARIQIAAEYRRLIQVIVLDEERTIRIHMKECDEVKAIYTLRAEGLIGLKVDGAGWSIAFGSSGLRVEWPGDGSLLDQAVQGGLAPDSTEVEIRQLVNRIVGSGLGPLLRAVDERVQVYHDGPQGARGLRIRSKPTATERNPLT